MVEKKLEVVGIWIGSPVKLPSLLREGIFRFLFNLVKHLLLHHALTFEIWCQQINLANVRELFSELLTQEDLGKRVSFHTELDDPKRFPGGERRRRGTLLLAANTGVFYLKTAGLFILDLMRKSKLPILLAVILLLFLAIVLLLRAGFQGQFPHWKYLLPFLVLLLFAIRSFRAFLESALMRSWDFLTKSSNLLPLVANRDSAADCFLIQNFDMANSWKIDRLKVVNLHDFYAIEFAPLFDKSLRSRRRRFQAQEAVHYAERLARDGSFFISNSDHIRRTHALAMIPGLREDNTGVIFLPAIIPERIIQKLPPRQEVLAAFQIEGDYIFYPTHIRPYKNVLTLLKAFKIVLDRGHALSLVLTGNLADDANCLAFVQQHGLLKKIILTREISEVNMYGLYRHAALAAVPTLSEGGFPWQALEAMAMEIPVIVSRIPVVEERLRYHELEADTCGLLMFEPHDENTLAQMIAHVLAHRGQVLSDQKKLRDVLLAYDWHQLSDRYFNLLTRLVGREC